MNEWILEGIRRVDGVRIAFPELENGVRKAREMSPNTLEYCLNHFKTCFESNGLNQQTWAYCIRNVQTGESILVGELV